MAGSIPPPTEWADTVERGASTPTAVNSVTTTAKETSFFMVVDREPVTMQIDLNDEVATAIQLQIKPSLRDGPGHARFQRVDREGSHRRISEICCINPRG